MAPAKTAFLSVFGNEGSDAAAKVGQPGLTATWRNTVGGVDSHNLLVVFQDSRYILEVHAFEAAPVNVSQLDCVILEAPVIALQRDNVVDLLEQIGDGGVVLGLDAEDYAHLGKGVTPDDKAKPDDVVSHRGIDAAEGVEVQGEVQTELEWWKLSMEYFRDVRGRDNEGRAPDSVPRTAQSSS